MAAGAPNDLYCPFPDLAANFPNVVFGNTALKVSMLNCSNEGGKALPYSSIK